MSTAIEDLENQFPWLKQLGITDQLTAWAAEPNITEDQLVADIRGSQQYKTILPGIFNKDGSMKMDEATYFQTRDQYKQALKSYSRGASEYDDPQDFAAFFEQDVKPDDLQQRLQAYDAISRGSQDVRDAWYVYAGKKLTDDELYLMTVDPTTADKYKNDYNRAVALQPLDYGTWITRATEAGLDRAVNTLTDLQKQGLVTGDAVDVLRRTNPEFARQITDALYHGGSQTGPFLQLNELMHAFEYSLIGGAAIQNGLQLPTQDRLEALRQAGVDRAAALKGYATIAGQQGQIQGALARAHLGKFTPADLEQAVILQTGPQVNDLNKALAQDAALSKAGGGAAVSQTQQGGFAEKGLYRP